jgi:hypothetical protein
MILYAEIMHPQHKGLDTAGFDTAASGRP